MRTIATLSLIILFCVSVFAQKQEGEGRGMMREKIEAQKISFITQKLSLTPEEAQLFWPVYNEMDKKKKEFHSKSKVLFKKLRHNTDELSDQELEEISDQLIEMRVQDATLDKEYHSKFKKILPPRKVLQLYHAEKQFHTMLLRQIKGRGERHQYHKQD